VYEDGWFNFKAAFEAFISVRDAVESAKLARFSGELQDIENHLPIPPALRNPRLGAMAPIRVVNVVLAAGDGNHGVQTAAYNLPNDERVVEKLGSKRVMLKNMQDAKFQKVLLPIAGLVLAPGDRAQVSFDAFFTHILMHELMHGLGPHNITVAGRATTVRQELKETYSTIEEAKADISGLFALQYLVDKGVLDASMGRSMYTTFLASAFRSIRFGLNESHGRGIAIQLNSLLDAGAFTVAPDGTFAIKPATIKEAVSALTRDIMLLQARGDYAAAKDMLLRYGVVRPEVKRALDTMGHVPVDIEPRFVTAAELDRIE
jgi:Peptidase family M49